jgi:hypothetical protein
MFQTVFFEARTTLTAVFAGLEMPGVESLPLPDFRTKFFAGSS